MQPSSAASIATSGTLPVRCVLRWERWGRYGDQVWSTGATLQACCFFFRFVFIILRGSRVVDTRSGIVLMSPCGGRGSR